MRQLRRTRRVVASRSLAGVVILLAALMLPACGSSGTPKAAGTSLTYWAVSMAPTLARDRAILGRELATFTRQTGIDVKLEIMSWKDAYARIMNAVAGGKRPDVVDVGNTWSATLQDTHAFVPFDTKAMAAIGGRARFLPTAMAATGAPGEPAASIPLLGLSYALYYNTKLFAQAGIDRPPATWTEFVADAVRLTKPGQWGIGLSAASAAMNAHLVFMLTRQHGGRLFDATGNPQFDSPAVRSAVTQLLDLMARSKAVNPSDAEQSGINDALADLAHGTVAMVPFQSGGRTYFSQIGFDDYAVAPLPVVSPLPRGGAAVHSIVGGTNLAVFADTSHRGAALRLVRFLTSDAEQIRLNAAYGTLPVVHGAYSDPAFGEPATAMFGRILRDSAVPMPRVPGEGQMERLLGGAISDLWAGAATGGVTQRDIVTALRNANRQMTASS